MALRELASGLQEASTVRRVFGEPVEREGVVVLPVARVQGMFGGGESEPLGKTGGSAAKGWGGGGGWSAAPAGVYVLKSGEVSWVPAVDANRTILLGCLTGIVSLLVVRSIVRGLARGG